MSAELRENLAPVQHQTTRNCYNCANFDVCQVRTTVPMNAMDMETNEHYAFSDKITPPMPCGGSAWEAINIDDKPQLVKRPDETWKQFMARKKATHTPYLQELP